MRITCSPQKAVRKTGFLSHLYIKMNVLPRQARDKHRENSKKSGVFRRDWPDLQCGAGPRELHVTDVCEQVKPQRLCPLFFHSYETRCFYQDRLRTNIRKTQQEEIACHTARPAAGRTTCCRATAARSTTNRTAHGAVLEAGAAGRGCHTRWL